MANGTCHRRPIPDGFRRSGVPCSRRAGAGSAFALTASSEAWSPPELDGAFILVNVSPPFLVSPDESRRVPISIPRPSDKRCARERLGACVAFEHAFPPRAFPRLGGSFPPFG